MPDQDNGKRRKGEGEGIGDWGLENGKKPRDCVVGASARENLDRRRHSPPDTVRGLCQSPIPNPFHIFSGRLGIQCEKC